MNFLITLKTLSLSRSFNRYMDSFISDISGQQFPMDQRILGTSIRQPIFKLIKKEYPDFSRDKYISAKELTQFKEAYITEFLKDEFGGLSQLDQEVIRSFKDNKVISASLDKELGAARVGDKIADEVAESHFILCGCLTGSCYYDEPEPTGR